jgi:membrane protease YdiL (CAAX protease family)
VIAQALARARSPRDRVARNVTWEPWIYLGVLGAIEYVSDIWRGKALLGTCLHALLLVLLLLRGSRSMDTPEGRFYVAISILPMVRIISFAMSPTYFHGVWYYVAAEGPLLAAALVAARVLRIPVRDIGWRRPRSLLLSGLIIASGPLVGWGEHLIIPRKLLVHPAPLASSLTWSHALLPAVLLVIFTGLVEETLFRGLIQQIASNWMGAALGIFYATVGWGLLHIGWQSWIDVLYVTTIGLFWGAARYYNRSTLDLGIAHGLANVVLFIVLPNTHLFQ